MKQIFDLLLNIDRKWRLIFISIIPLSIIKSFFDVVGLGLVAPFISSVVSPETILENTYFIDINEYIGISSNSELVVFSSIFLITFFIIKGVYSILVLDYINYFIFHGKAEFNGVLMQKYLQAEWKFHQKNNSSYLDRNLRVSSNKAFSCLSYILKSFVDAFFVIFSIALLIYAQGMLTIYAASVFILLFFCWYKFSFPYLAKIGSMSIQASGESSKIIRENFDSIREIITFDVASFFTNKYEKKERYVSSLSKRQAFFQILPTAFIEIIAISLLAGTCLYLVLSGEDLVDFLPILGLFGLVIIRLLPILLNFIRSVQEIIFEFPAIDLINNQIHELDNSFVKQSENNNLVFSSLELQKITFSYGSKNIFTDLNIKIEHNDSVGIMGPSGSGKTTVLNIMLGLLKPDSGEVLLNDCNLYSSLSSWRNQISFVPQEPILFDDSIRENITFGQKNITDHAVWEALKLVKLFDLFQGYDQKIDSKIGERGSNLSGGQKQRLSLARALVRNPKVIFLDEFTSALDKEVELRILQDLFAIQDITIILISHSQTVIDFCKEKVILG
jgi:ATP-binding cassette subfamily B protein/ATP-binding cassette subfamily C protein